MAPTPSKSNHSTTPSSKPNSAHHQPKTPQSKLRLNFPKETTATATATAPPEHPVEVVGRIRNHPEQKNKHNANPSALQINSDGKSLRVKTEIGYRDFSLDGVSMSENDDLDGFYRKFVESRINGVRLGQKCTIMMYGPTGSGKSHTMFGSSTQSGIVYRALKDILGDGEEGDVGKLGMGIFVQVTVLEIYNEEIYDLLSSANAGGGFSIGWSKGGSASKARLEVMGKKAKNATFISGNEAGKMLKEIQKVEKRRIVKSTLCNERSSRSHCLIILDVPTVGGRLMLVDMAGSENIEQAGQNGLEAKMQTGKINQGNTALKRVVESIANGDSHVPFRDSKLTMLLQDSFEDDKSKILMILCASPDPKELHKTIATLEYGRKPTLDQFICKLQIENKLKEKECNEAKKELKKKEQEVSALRAKIAIAEGRGKETSEEDINSKVNERTQMLKNELEMKIQECQQKANEYVEMERRKMEEIIFQQQQEVEMLRRRLEEIESADMKESGFMKRLLEACLMIRICKACLTTVFEEEEYENEEDDKENEFEEEVEKGVIEEKKVIIHTPEVSNQDSENSELRGSDELGNPNDAASSQFDGGSGEMSENSMENHKPLVEEVCGDIEVYVKWEASKENPGKFITTLKVSKDSTLADLRKLIEIHLGVDQKAFAFLVLGDPSGAPVPKEKEITTHTSKLPICNNQIRGRLACLRPIKPIQAPSHLPFSPLENKMGNTPNSHFKKNDNDCVSPKIAENLCSTPFIAIGKC
ncbi:hypothetical protein DH2020_004632 [Rehmannia glutinosa]|uniref:Kinesin motor domain-containing protein n=1 Tax=Rehmannia glutinosa TaxID=99300 RepID=A0ABR0XQ97_REHGL